MKFYLNFLMFCLLSTYSSQALAYMDELDELLSQNITMIKEEPIHYNALNYDHWSTEKNHTLVRKKIQKMDLATLETDEEKLAFWINAYNFFIIDLIIQKGERDGITDLSGAKSVWDRYEWSVGKEVVTLNDIKNKYLRPLNDPRIHFALACAGKSCPDIRTEAYRPEKIDGQLSDQVKTTLQNRTKGFDVLEDKNTIRVSKIMEWEKEDFNKGNVRSWLQPHAPLFINATTKVEYFDFDWSLNN